MRARAASVILLVAAASPVAAQSGDEKQCSFRSGTTCWTIWGRRAAPLSSRPTEQPKSQPRDTLPVLAEGTSRRPVRR